MEKRITQRTPETQTKYEAFRKTPECAIPFFWDRAKIVKEYTYWRIVENDFPYDTMWERHYMLAPIRKVTAHRELTEEEKKEFLKIKESEFMAQFDQFLENMGETRTMPGHLHYHLGRLFRVDDL